MKYLIQNKYWEIDKEYDKEKLLYLLIDSPDYINANNDFFWVGKINKCFRNYNLPAFVSISKTNVTKIFWYENYKITRVLFW